jgi:hypothetical protein
MSAVTPEQNSQSPQSSSQNSGSPPNESEANAPQDKAKHTWEFAAEPAKGSRRSRRRLMLTSGAVVVVAAAGVVVGIREPYLHSHQSTSGVVDNATPTQLQKVTEGTLSSQIPVSATLDYTGSYTAINQASGLYSTLPRVGGVYRRGNVLYRVSGAPVILLYGSIPAYRTLSSGMSGPDVKQLNANLVALKYATKAELDPTSDYFSWETEVALESLQADLGVTQTGQLTLGQAVFLPIAVRITSVTAQLGNTAGPGAPAFSASSINRQVTVPLAASEQSYVHVGDKVTITLPDNSTTPGTVSSVGTVATPGSGGNPPTVNVDVTLKDPSATGSLVQAPVQVNITTATVNSALAVPVDALLALVDGGYAVEVVEPNGTHRFVPVTLGLFDDQTGTVQVTGTSLAVGQNIVVPNL